MARWDNSSLINAAVTAIQRGEFTDYTKAAEHFKCSHSAISRRVRGLTKPRKLANTIEQEEVLIDRINYLTDRAMPPPAILSGT
jgi:hypothetical protein